MAPTFAGVVAATVTALWAWIPVPPAGVVEAVAGRALNTIGDTLAGRRGVRLLRPIVVRLLDRPHMRVAREAHSQTSQSPEAARDQTALHAFLGLEEARGRDAPDRSDLAGVSDTNLPHFQDGPPLPDGAPLPNLHDFPDVTHLQSLQHTVPVLPDVSGLYDAVKGHLLMGNWVDLKADRFVLARDVAIAVLDRRFDLRTWLTTGLPSPDPLKGRSEDNSDAVLARQALVEGDAAVQALEHVEPQGILPPPRALAGIMAEARAGITSESARLAPLGLEQRLFVELDGLAFVARMRERAAWSAIDAVWAHSPQSTEQVLHPEKYEKREKPDDVGSRLPHQSWGRWQADYRDTLGELGARIFLQRAVNDYRAERGAAGWGGDTALLLRASETFSRTRGAFKSNRDAVAETDGPSTFAAWITTWDDDTDAEDFATQAARVLAALAQAPVGDDHPASGRLRLTDSVGRIYVLDRRGRSVGMLFAAPKDAEAMLSALMVAAVRVPHRGTDHDRAGSK